MIPFEEALGTCRSAHCPTVAWLYLYAGRSFKAPLRRSVALNLARLASPRSASSVTHSLQPFTASADPGGGGGGGDHEYDDRRRRGGGHQLQRSHTPEWVGRKRARPTLWPSEQKAERWPTFTAPPPQIPSASSLAEATTFQSISGPGTGGLGGGLRARGGA